MSEEPSGAQKPDYSDSAWKIRSKHRRRLLDRLTEGGATVSDLARDVDLRVPHASAEIKRLRIDGLVSSDLSAGSRGARIHLTESGWESVRADEWVRASEASPMPDDSSMCCLLSRDGPNLLLGMMEPRDSPLLLIPDRPPVPIPGDPGSTGSEGVPWSWAVLRERNPRWFDLSSMEPKPSPPPPSDPENIDAYSGERTVVGIIRARLLDAERPIAIAPGQWFSTPDFRPAPPLPEREYHRGPWVLGACHEMSPEIRPKEPVVAVMEDRLPRSMLLRTARANSLVIADLGGLDTEGDPYPLAALDPWIESAHPRLRDAERRRRLGALRDRVSKSRKARTEDSTWRRFRRDWGESTFTEEADSISVLDLRGLRGSAAEALIRWAVNDDAKPPLTVEIGSNVPDELVSSIASHSNLRLALLGSEATAFAGFDRLDPDPLRPLPWLRLTTKGGRVLPMRLVEPTQVPMHPGGGEAAEPDWHSLGVDVESLGEIDEGHLSVINSAMAQHPGGNEEWANQMEAKYPIAAWIASPARTRWPRWQRLRKRLSPEWLVLMDMDDLPLERLSEVADEAPDAVLQEFATKIASRLRTDSEAALRTRPATDPKEATRGVSWVAAQMLSNAPWLPEHMHSDLLSWALEAWLSDPPRDSMPALQGVAWLHSSGRSDKTTFRPILEGIRSKGRESPSGHDLHTWANLADIILDDSEIVPGDLEGILELPPGWWAPISVRILSGLFEDEDTTEWAIANPVSWCAAVLRPVGDRCEAPGLRSFKHPGCDSEIYSHLSRRLRGRRERAGLPESADPLLDLLDALDAVNNSHPPPQGRTHPLSGWLAQPLEKWPDFSSAEAMDGDAHITERLLLRSSGYHTGIVPSTSISG